MVTGGIRQAGGVAVSQTGGGLELAQLKVRAARAAARASAIFMANMVPHHAESTPYGQCTCHDVGVGCCRSGSACACVISAEADDGCNPITTTITGAGSVGSPFVVGTAWDPTRVFRLDGNEPWTTQVVGGCTIIVPRCRYSAA